MEATIKAHYYIENCVIIKDHPDKWQYRNIPSSEDPSKIACTGHNHCDILETYQESLLVFVRVRVYLMPNEKEVIGWTIKDNIDVKFDCPLKDGRFNRK